MGAYTTALELVAPGTGGSLGWKCIESNNPTTTNSANTTAEHIAGAVNLPLSSFDPARLPAADGKTVILQCAGGKRSGMALDRCAEAQAAIDTHLAGGLGAWKSAGLPVERG